MSLLAVFDQFEFNRYDFGTDINFKLYNADGKTAFNATGYTATIKAMKRAGDKSYFFRDVEKAITIMGEMAQIITDIVASWDTESSGLGHFAWTQTARPSVPGYMYLIVQLTKSGATISSKPVRVYVNPSEAQ